MKAYQLKITIKGSKPPIWRRVIVPAGLSFAQLALVFNEVMGWEGYHLNSFEFNTLGVLIEDKSMDDFPFAPYDILEQSEEIIDEYLDNEKRFLYVYDFGDDWEHKVEVEKIIPDYDKNYPMVIKSKGPILPEDCGGIYGYYEMLRISENPDDPAYDDIMMWSADGDLLHMEYDIEEINYFLETYELIDKTCPPMSLTELYENTSSPFMHVVKGTEKESDEADVYDEQALIVEMTITKVIMNLEKNTDLSLEEIFRALELGDENIEPYHEMKAMLLEMEEEGEGIKLN